MNLPNSLEGFARRSIPAGAVEGTWIAPDGHTIRRIDWPPPVTASAVRGSLLFLSGRGDFYEKYLETFAHWHALGWRITAFDWRGQGGSGRLAHPGNVGHISDFSVWVNDLAQFWAEWDAEGPRVVVAHSMGGHIALRTLAERKIDPVALVLSAPMLGFAAPGPRLLLHAAARLMALLGDPARPAWQGSEKPGSTDEGRQQLLTHDLARYADEVAWRQMRPQLSLGPPSWRWVERAYASFAVLARRGFLEAVQTPVLIHATRADRLVSWQAIARAAKRLPQGQVMFYGEQAAHELFREEDGVRSRVLQATDDFFDRFAPASAAFRDV